MFSMWNGLTQPKTHSFSVLLLPPTGTLLFCVKSGRGLVFLAGLAPLGTSPLGMQPTLTPLECLSSSVSAPVSFASDHSCVHRIGCRGDVPPSTSVLKHWGHLAPGMDLYASLAEPSTVPVCLLEVV